MDFSNVDGNGQTLGDLLQASVRSGDITLSTLGAKTEVRTQNILSSTLWDSCIYTLGFDNTTVTAAFIPASTTISTVSATALASQGIYMAESKVNVVGIALLAPGNIMSAQGCPTFN
jgi:hypothetical protein